MPFVITFCACNFTLVLFFFKDIATSIPDYLFFQIKVKQNSFCNANKTKHTEVVENILVP